MLRRSNPPVPPALVQQIDRALEDLAAAEARLPASEGQPLAERREAHGEVARAYATADRLLREATHLARAGRYGEWRRWRGRLSRLSTAKQKHLFAARDDLPVTGLGTVRAVDTGMAGPSIGEMMHGAAKAPGAPSTYGLDVDVVVAALASRTLRPAAPRARRAAGAPGPDLRPAA